jgi:hypothetical protein
MNDIKYIDTGVPGVELYDMNLNWLDAIDTYSFLTHPKEKVMDFINLNSDKRVLNYLKKINMLEAERVKCKTFEERYKDAMSIVS